MSLSVADLMSAILRKAGSALISETERYASVIDDQVERWGRLIHCPEEPGYLTPVMRTVIDQVQDDLPNGSFLRVSSEIAIRDVICKRS